MKVPHNFRLRKEDERILLSYLKHGIDKFPTAFDPILDGRIVLVNSREELLSTATIKNQLVALAYKARETMVATALQLCAWLSGEKVGKYSVVGAYFLRESIYSALERRKTFPDHQDAIVGDKFALKRDKSFYDKDFWTSPIVRAWVVVHIVNEWFSCDMENSWATPTAESAN